MSIVLGDRPSQRKARSAAIGLAVFALLGGVLSFLGYAADVPRLTDWFGNGISIQPNATLAVGFSGFSILLLLHQYRRAALAAGTVVLAVGALTLFEYVSGLSLGIDDLFLFDRQWGRVGVVWPGRMGLPGAISWTVIGFSLVLAAGNRDSARRVAPYAVLASTLIASLSLIGYLYGASPLFMIPNLTVIAFQTSTFVLAVSVAVVLSVPDKGPMLLLADDGPAGALVRRLLPGVILLPLVLGIVRLAGERAGLYDLAFGTAARTLIEIVLLLSLVWWTTRAIERLNDERVRAEAALSGREHDLRTTLEGLTDGLVTIDREWRFSYVNAEAERLLQVSRATLLGQNVWTMFPESMGTEAQTELQRVLANGDRVEFEHFNARLKVWFFNKAYPVEAGITVHFQDITARKETAAALERSRDMLEADLADSGALQALGATLMHEDDVQALYESVLDTAMRLVSSQFASIQICEGDPGAPTGLRLLASRGFDDAARALWAWVDVSSASICSRAFATGTRVEVADVRTWDGQAATDYLNTGIVAVQSTPLVSRGGALLGMLSSHWSEPHTCSERELRLLDLVARQAADILERRQHEEALRESDRRKDAFLATLAHELRNPLAPIRSAIQYFRTCSGMDAEASRVGEIAERQAAAMSRLLDDLLDVGRIVKDRLQLKSEPADLRSVLRRAVEMSAPFIEQSSHTLQFSVPESPVWVFGDPVRLTQIVGNLLNNSCRYTGPHGRIWLSLEGEAGDAIVTVRDNGIGIPKDQLANIFEMFSQVDTSSESSQGGLGLGLHLVKRLAELHSGRIEAHSEGPGTGSTFVLRLPAFEMTSRAAEPNDQPVVAPVRPSSRRVLIVDDNADAATMLSTLLEVSHHQTEVAHDGSQALSKADAFRPDAVLLDIGLPQLNGYEVCRALRSRPWGKEITVIAVTGWGQDGDRARSEAAGFDHHLVKPIEHDALLRLLASLPARSAS